jgi:crossover junction endodeoxyribonuclease RuvC
MRILGIDPGLHLTGYGCIDLIGRNRDPRLIEAGVIRLKPATPISSRLNHLNIDLCELLDELKPDRIVVEKLFSHYGHVLTAILMGHARGVVLLAAAQRSIALDELLPTAVKKAITGRGHATKRQVQMAVMGQLKLAEPPSPPDVADAIAIALTGARRLT